MESMTKKISSTVLTAAAHSFGATADYKKREEK